MGNSCNVLGSLPSIHSKMHAPGDMLSSLAARIRELRAARELSQEDVAAHVGVSQAKWSRIERTGKLSVDELVV